MNKFVSALAVLTVGGTVLASGVATAAAAPAASNAHKPHKVARSTSATHGKAAPLSSTTAAKAAAKPQATPKVNANDSVVLKQYNFESYRALDADTDTLGGNGTRVQLWDDAGSDAANQTWVYTSTDTAGLYKINNLASGRSLDADSDTIGGNGTTVQLWDDLGVDAYNQDWEF
jgi:Ricin-type beta-trefoil lectin domain-like